MKYNSISIEIEKHIQNDIWFASSAQKIPGYIQLFISSERHTSDKSNSRWPLDKRVPYPCENLPLETVFPTISMTVWLPPTALGAQTLPLPQPLPIPQLGQSRFYVTPNTWSALRQQYLSLAEPLMLRLSSQTYWVFGIRTMSRISLYIQSSITKQSALYSINVYWIKHITYRLAKYPIEKSQIPLQAGQLERELN